MSNYFRVCSCDFEVIFPVLVEEPKQRWDILRCPVQASFKGALVISFCRVYTLSVLTDVRGWKGTLVNENLIQFADSEKTKMNNTATIHPVQVQCQSLGTRVEEMKNCLKFAEKEDDLDLIREERLVGKIKRRGFVCYKTPGIR